MKKYFGEKQSKLIHAWINQADKTPNDYLKFMSNWIALMNQFMPKWRLHRNELNSLPIVHNDWGIK